MSDASTDKIREQLRLSEARKQWMLAGGALALVLLFAGAAETMMLQASARRLGALHENFVRIDAYAKQAWERQDRVVAEVTAVTGPIDVVDHELERFAGSDEPLVRLKAARQLTRALGDAVEGLDRDSDPAMIEYLRLKAEVDAYRGMLVWIETARRDTAGDWKYATEHHTARIVLATGVVSSPEPGWLEGA